MENNLSAILGRRRLKIKQVSDETGISRTTLTELYYCRSKGITFEVLFKLCDYLSITPNDLLIVESM